MANFQRESVTFDQALDFTRGSEATYFDSSGVLQTAAVNEPRFDHDPVTGEPLGLLIEGQRTNLFLWSEDLTSASPFGATVTPNSASAPDGSLTADKLVEDAGDSNHQVFKQTSSSITVGTAVSGSVYLKAAERSEVALFLFSGAFTSSSIVTFDLLSGSSSDPSGRIEPVGNGWWRASISKIAEQTDSGTRLYVRIGAYQGDGISGIYIWGAQLEEGTQPSSYIPTTDAQVTRAADNCRRTLGQEFNPSDEFTLYSEFTFHDDDTFYAIIGDADNNFNCPIFKGSGGRLGYDFRGIGGAFDYVTNGAIPGESYMAAISINAKTGDIVFALNGQSYAYSGPGLDFSSWNAFLVGSRASDTGLSTVARVGGIPRALTEAELIALTAPEAE